jgi:hypothetical protein
LELIWLTDGEIVAEAVSPGTAEGSTIDGSAGTAGVVLFIAEIGFSLSVELRLDNEDLLLLGSTGFAAGPDCSVVDADG